MLLGWRPKDESVSIALSSLMIHESAAKSPGRSRRRRGRSRRRQIEKNARQSGIDEKYTRSRAGLIVLQCFVCFQSVSLLGEAVI